MPSEHLVHSPGVGAGSGRCILALLLLYYKRGGTDEHPMMGTRLGSKQRKGFGMTSRKRNKTALAEDMLRKAERYEGMGDFRKAFKCLLAGAQLGDAGSQLNLGNFYALGTGVRRNPSKSAYWYRKAYRNGYGVGARNLAIDRRNEGNMRSAVVWFRRAIAMKDGEAYIELAKIYSARKGGRRAVVGLLRRALRLSRYDISEAGREEAESLLKTMAGTRT